IKGGEAIKIHKFVKAIKENAHLQFTSKINVDKMEEEIDSENEKDKENKKEQRETSEIEKEIASIIEKVERLMSEKGLQAQDLGEYSNYKEKINELDKIWKIRDLRDRIIENNFEEKYGSLSDGGLLKQLKADIDALNERPNTTQEEYNKILNNQEKHTADDLEKHKPEDLKPADYDQNIKDLTESKKILTDIQDYYKEIGLDQFGENIDKESLKKIKDELDTLINNQEENTEKNLKPADYETTKTDLDK
ncbi:995_t:CDS:2, partial [Cetraspora pellucida]